MNETIARMGCIARSGGKYVRAKETKLYEKMLEKDRRTEDMEHEKEERGDGNPHGL